MGAGGGADGGLREVQEEREEARQASITEDFEGERLLVILAILPGWLSAFGDVARVARAAAARRSGAGQQRPAQAQYSERGRQYVHMVRAHGACEGGREGSLI